MTALQVHAGRLADLVGDGCKLDWLLLALLGLGTGAFGVMVGIGGGLILVPMLLLFFDIEPAVVAGTTLALVAINSFSGSAAYSLQGLVDRRSGLLFGAAAIPGAITAPFVVAAVAGSTFRVLFGLLLLGVAIHTLVWSCATAPEVPKRPARAFTRDRRIITRRGQRYEYRYNEALATAFNVVVGFISTFFGTGGGFIRTPVLVAAFGFPVRVAVATSIFAMSIYATAGALVHALLGHVDLYPTLVWVGAGLLVGSQLGVPLSSRVQSVWLMRLLVLLLLIMGARLLMQGALG